MTALYVHTAILWLAFLGMVAFPSRSPMTRRAKQLGAITFVAIVVESCRVTGTT